MFLPLSATPSQRPSVPLLLDRSLRQTVSPSLSPSAGQSLSKSQLPPQWRNATQLPDRSATQSTSRLPVSTALSTRLSLSLPRLTPMSTMDTAREPLMPMELASPSAVVTTKHGSVPPFSSPMVPEQFHCHNHSQNL